MTDSLSNSLYVALSSLRKEIILEEWSLIRDSTMNIFSKWDYYIHLCDTDTLSETKNCTFIKVGLDLITFEELGLEKGIVISVEDLFGFISSKFSMPNSKTKDALIEKFGDYKWIRYSDVKYMSNNDNDEYEDLEYYVEPK